MDDHAKEKTLNVLKLKLSFGASWRFSWSLKFLNFYSLFLAVVRHTSWRKIYIVKKVFFVRYFSEVKKHFFLKEALIYILHVLFVNNLEKRTEKNRINNWNFVVNRKRDKNFKKWKRWKQNVCIWRWIGTSGNSGNCFIFSRNHTHKEKTKKKWGIHTVHMIALEWYLILQPWPSLNLYIQYIIQHL